MTMKKERMTKEKMRNKGEKVERASGETEGET